MKSKNKEYTFCEEGLDTLMYLLEKEELELRSIELKRGLNEIDTDLLFSIKDCKRVINNIEKRAKNTKEKYLSSYEKKKKSNSKTQK